MITIAIECESVEKDVWGVSREVRQLLFELSKRSDLADTHRFILYFKSKIPDWNFLNRAWFTKKIVALSFPPIRSFTLYYFLLLPLRLLVDKPDVVFLPNFMLPFFVRTKSFVMLTEDVYYEMRSPQQKWRYRLAYRLFSNHAARHARALMAISDNSKTQITKLFGVPPSRIFVNHLGVDIVQGNFSKPNFISGRYILTVCQAFPRRHVKEILEAFAMVAPQERDLHMVFIGSDRYLPPIIDRLTEEINIRLGRVAVVHLDTVEQSVLFSLYSHASVFCYISTVEAFGLPPLESLAAGIRPIVADTPLTRELFQGNCYYVTPPIHASSIANAIIQNLSTIEDKMKVIENARPVLEHLTWFRHTQHFLEICNTITAHNE